MLKTYRIGDFAGVNYNRDLTTSDFAVATRALNVDFVGGTGISGRPAFRTFATAGGSEWYTWCEALGGSQQSMRNTAITASGSSEPFTTTPIILRTPQAGSANIWAVSQFDASVIASSTQGGVNPTYVNQKNAQIAGGLSITGTDIASNWIIAMPSGHLIRFVSSAFSAITLPASGSYNTNSVDFSRASHCAVLTQSRRLIVGQRDTIWFSDPDNFTFTSGNYLTIGGYGNGGITNMIETPEGVYVFSSNGIIFIYGETSDANGNAILQYRRISDEGCSTPYYGVTKGPSGIFFLGDNGLYKVSGVSISKVQTPCDYTWGLNPWANPDSQTGRDSLGSTSVGKDTHYFPYHFGVIKYTSATTTSDPSNGSIGVHQSGRKLYLYGKSPDLGSTAAVTLANTNGGTWVMDIPTNKWSYWDISPNCMTNGYQLNSTTANRNEARDSAKERLYFVSSGAGLTNWSAKTLCRSDASQDSDSPAAFKVDYWTGYGSLGSPGVNKRFSGYRVWGQGSSSYPVTTSMYCDFETTSRAPTGSFSSGEIGTQIGYRLLDAGVTGSCVSLRLQRISSGQKWHIGAVDLFYDDVGPGTILAARNASGGDT